MIPTLTIYFLACIAIGFAIGRLWTPSNPIETDRAFCDLAMKQERFDRAMFYHRTFAAGVKAERMRNRYTINQLNEISLSKSI